MLDYWLVKVLIYSTLRLSLCFSLMVQGCNPNVCHMVRLSVNLTGFRDGMAMTTFAEQFT